MGTLVWRLLGTGSALLTGVLANKLVAAIFKKAGRDSTHDPRDPRTSIGDAIAYAAVTGLAVGVARTIVTRRAASIYAKAAGHLPKAMEQGDA